MGSAFFFSSLIQEARTCKKNNTNRSERLYVLSGWQQVPSGCRALPGSGLCSGRGKWLCPGTVVCFSRKLRIIWHTESAAQEAESDLCQGWIFVPKAKTWGHFFANFIENLLDSYLASRVYCVRKHLNFVVKPDLQRKCFYIFHGFCH